eukprot:473583-Alexandrium_andersonii.AAC.1
MSALDYRSLSVLPIVYRTWGKIRLRCLSDWFPKWRHLQTGTYAGVPGVGAQDGWMLAALKFE